MRFENKSLKSTEVDVGSCLRCSVTSATQTRSWSEVVKYCWTWSSLNATGDLPDSRWPLFVVVDGARLGRDVGPPRRSF